MISSIKKYFDSRIRPDDPTDEINDDRSIKLATAALLLEVSRADYSETDIEKEVIERSVMSGFGLSEEDARELLDVADEQAHSASSYHEFTSLINDHMGPQDKIGIVEQLWQVAYADSVLDKHENHIIRKIASLLHVPHKEYIAAKIRVRDRKGT